MPSPRSKPEQAENNSTERDVARLQEIARSLLRQNQELAKIVEQMLPLPPARFIPNPFQEEILAALDGKGLRTDALCLLVAGGSKHGLYRARGEGGGGLLELMEQGLVANHPRVGYYRPDAPPGEFSP